MNTRKLLVLIAIYMAIPAPLIALGNMFGGIGMCMFYAFFVLEVLFAVILFKGRNKGDSSENTRLKKMLFVSICFLKWVGYIPFIIGYEFLY